MYSNFIDLDELIVLCRDKSTKKFIQESVACYRAGAYRYCIVSTWNAVVLYFLHKLRQDVIKSIFQEDRKQKGHCDSYWFDFRKKIDKLNNSHIEILINVIDSDSKEVEVQ